ncbi:ferredoxin--NADP reductase [Polaribacter sp. Z022]|uniref:ferredoxin--NADP reductase n=1 Tax=Polaribacter sp. Z022 TaxID=2927125 RepID=UPI002021C792|nr:ferredoxin--NADP reductase [Polaribacter sp. Z022]MCL7752140.1 ferredoxin--NADP reductase [Polaribacter sp. Z022]
MYTLKVLEVKKETKDAVSVAFDVSYELYDAFNYKPGQFLTLQFNLKGQQVRRSYSLCSSPVLEEPLQIGVKRVKNGLVSNHINDNLKAGDVVEVLPPDGRFFADIKKENYKTYYLFAAGSGITPILSILKTVLLTEERSYVYIIFGNRNQESIMFQKELEELKQSFKDRLILIHTLSRPINAWSDLWKTSSSYNYKKGRIDSSMVKWFINEYPPYAQNAEYYICGPGSMISNTKRALKNIDVPDSRIFTESFGGTIKGSNIKGVVNAKLIAKINNTQIELTVPEGKTILRTLIDKGLNPPFSCEGGVCSTCVCKLKQGKVHMKNNLSLDESEVEKGYILSCQSIPLTQLVEVEYSK